MRKLCATLNSKPHEATPISSSSQDAQRQVMDQNGELQANITKYFTAALRFKFPKYFRVNGNQLSCKSVKPRALAVIYTFVCAGSKRI